MHMVVSDPALPGSVSGIVGALNHHGEDEDEDKDH